jgi:hypothetical protein
MASLNKSNDISDISNSTAFKVLICIVIIFLVIVTFGWSRILAPVIAVPFVPIVCGFAIAFAGVLLGKAVAVERMRIKSETSPQSTKTWWAYFAVLFFISALGTMNTMFMGTLQSSEFGNEISRTNEKLGDLKSKINHHLSTSSYDKQRDKVNIVFGNFQDELRNPANCGMGTKANKHFRELKALLPNLEELSIGGGGCKNVEKLIEVYGAKKEILLLDLPETKVRSLYIQRIELTKAIEDQISILGELKVQLTSLDKEILPKLQKAWKVYEESLQKAKFLSDADFGLQAKIENQNVIGIGGISQILPLMFEHREKPLAYLILIAAVFFDILLIQFFSRYFYGLGLKKQEEESTHTVHPSLSSSKARNLFEDGFKND